MVKLYQNHSISTRARKCPNSKKKDLVIKEIFYYIFIREGFLNPITCSMKYDNYVISKNKGWNVLKYLQSINLCSLQALICIRNITGDGRPRESESSKDLMTAEEKYPAWNCTEKLEPPPEWESWPNWKKSSLLVKLLITCNINPYLGHICN